MRREEDRELWDLLGQVKPAQVSAFFARNIIRRLREEPRLFDQLRTSFSFRWLIPASAVATAIIAGIIMVQHQESPPAGSESLPEIVAKIDPQDYEVVADLDVLLASDESNLWEENQSL